MLDLINTSLPGLYMIGSNRITDNRGFFERLFCAADLDEVLNGESIQQINASFTESKGTIRGLHYQITPMSETKLVRCQRGRVFDVVVDIRRESPTFLRWHAEVLEGSDPKSLLIGCGFAHGFQTLTDDCEMLYLHTKPYSPIHERGINPRDPALGIPWPESISDISIKDSERRFLDGHYEALLP